MKKTLLTFCLFAAIGAQAQKEVVINEFVPDPNVGQGKTEYIELYNTTASAINLDCYTLVAYDFNVGGVWVYQLPNVNIGAFGFVVFAAAKPVVYKFGSFDSSNIYSWNATDVTASLTHYDRSGNSLINPQSGPTTDFIPIAGGNSAALAIMLFDGTGTLTNGFFTNNGTTVPTEVTTLLDLNINLAGTCAPGTASLNFAGITAPAAEVLSVQQAVGNNNNYFRERDGFCGTWTKGESAPNFTPAKKNSSLPPINTSTAVTLAALETGCGNNTGDPTKSLWNITVSITDAGLVPGYYYIYEDADYSNGLNAGDVLRASGTIPSTSPVALTGIAIKKGSAAIVQVVTASGCIVVTRVFSSQCSPLPAIFNSFTAIRNHSNVMLKWETMLEQNCSGFAVERNINGTWQQIAFVPSQAVGGNSSDLLTYQYIDLNNTKGISQYRIRQVDFDNKSKYSEIRSVRGDGQIGQVIVYPNPTMDGKVNVSFEDATATREVSLIDMSGRMLRQWKAVTNNNIMIDNLTPGMYTLRVVIPETGEQNVQKIVVNKR